MPENQGVWELHRFTAQFSLSQYQSSLFRTVQQLTVKLHFNIGKLGAIRTEASHNTRVSFLFEFHF